MPRVALTASRIESTVAQRKAIELRDIVVPGLVCRIRSSGRKTFQAVSERRGARWTRKLGAWPSMTLKMARDAAKRVLGEQAGRDVLPDRYVGRGTLREFAARYFERVPLRAKDEARRVLEKDWAPLLDRPLREITRGRIEQIRSGFKTTDPLRGESWSAAPATTNRKVTVLRAVLSRAVEWGELLIHPMKGMKPLHVTGDARVRTLSDAERGRIYGVIDAKDCDPEIGTAVYLLLNTGARMGELRGLRPEDVDRRQKTINIRATTSKTAKTRRIPINALLAARLKTHRTWATPTRKQWDAVMKRAQVEKFTPHHARHDFLSRLANGGVPVHVVAALAGHSSIVLTGRYYLHTADDALRAAVERF